METSILTHKGLSITFIKYNYHCKDCRYVLFWGTSKCFLAQHGGFQALDTVTYQAKRCFQARFQHENCSQVFFSCHNFRTHCQYFRNVTNLSPAWTRSLFLKFLKGLSLLIKHFTEWIRMMNQKEFQKRTQVPKCERCQIFLRIPTVL
jgi:hypothetical protein